MASLILDPSLVAEEMALSFEHLNALCGVRRDCIVDERIYPLRNDALEDHPSAEFRNIEEFDTTPEYSCLSHPYVYSSAKHLSERLLLKSFEVAGRKNKLPIFRPSCIG
ncbi:hypothetical protein MBLNU13_g05274t1 [Cladosporium sp. NU13]